VWVPSWIADDLATIEPNADGYIFGAAQGSTWPVGRWRSRRFDRWARDYGWEQLPDYCSHEDHDADSCRGQNRRRWRHSIHDWRHAAAVWQLFELRLDPEDVAQHLGHGDGYTLYQLYVGARPGRAQRAAKAVEELGDPRSRLPSCLLYDDRSIKTDSPHGRSGAWRHGAAARADHLPRASPDRHANGRGGLSPREPASMGVRRGHGEPESRHPTRRTGEPTVRSSPC